jgi:hypothetical protein
LSNTRKYTWVAIKKFVKNKINNNNNNNNNYNSRNNNHHIIVSHYNISNINLKENQRRPRKKFTIRVWIRSKNSARLPFSSRFFLIGQNVLTYGTAQIHNKRRNTKTIIVLWVFALRKIIEEKIHPVNWGNIFLSSKTRRALFHQIHPSKHNIHPKYKFY